MQKIDEDHFDDILGDRLDPIIDRLDRMQCAQMKTNSRVVRLAFMASFSSQVAVLMLLINSTSWLAVAVNLIAVGATILAGWKVAPQMGRAEWPSRESERYDPYDG